MSKKCKKAPAGLSFSGALSATIRFLPKDGASDTSIPEQCRPFNRQIVSCEFIVGTVVKC